ncbi:acriflavine resistance protein B [Endozoicomonas montiporae]|uniref:Acriflavine resistance protein B n=2 Tax=Endozoicomonas montiporae TaxID=1027273 RepID=A0A081N0R5_9GAMM|nr:efflux RND transporter permease subunit [Endozoicomonas montiporae]AMO54519.1 AcrB/AcrD/AcrF family protein [Endozoicomonas montiporae CL-33]KEQ12038.1 acriflavine resistance protein B [Endozoicomonas montiporae]
MKWLTRWFLDNPVAANLLMLMILAGGYLTLDTIRVESFPQLPPSELEIMVAYPGGTAQQIDESITQRIEEAISSVAGVHRITSTSRRGYSSVKVRKTTETDLDRLMDDIRNEVDGITGFPAQAERPKIYRDEFTMLASFVMVAGDVEPELLQQSARRVEQALLRHPDISKVTNLDKRQPQILIEPDPEQLKRYGIGPEELAALIQQWSLEYRSGELKTSQGNILLRADGYADSLSQLRQLPVINTSDASVTLGNIARLERTYEDSDSLVRFQRKPAVALMISTSQKDNLFDVSEAVEEVLEELRSQLPASIELDVMVDLSPYIEGQLKLLGSNAVQGLLIILVLLGLFLNLRLAFWVAIGIPVSVSGALWMMGMLDYSLNDITLFGMILVLGVLVDDAVVVGESIHEARQRIADPKEAAWHGVESVTVATVFGVLTTIAAFSPMLWIQNDMAKILSSFSAVVILALLFSLVESKFILPAHLSYARRPTKATSNPLVLTFERIQLLCSSSLDAFSTFVYQPSLRFALAHRFTVLVLFVSFFLLTIGLVAKGAIHAVFFPDIPSRYVQAKITMDQDALMPLSVINADRLEDALERTSEALQQRYAMAEPPLSKAILSITNTANIELTAELTSEALSEIPGNALIDLWQEKTGTLEGVYSSSFKGFEHAGGGIGLTVSASDRELARQASAVLKQYLQQMPGVNDIVDDGQGGQREIQVQLNERGRHLGVTKQQLAILVGGAFGDLEVNRLIDQGEEIRVIVRYARDLRQTREQLLMTPVFLQDGSSMPLGEVAELTYTRESGTIHRRDRDLVVTVNWRQDRSVMAPEEVWKRLEKQAVPDIERQFPSVKVRAIGEFEDIAEVQAGIKMALILTLILVYALLAVPLKSYVQPLIIMSIIPFGFAGAVLGHGIVGLPVSSMSVFGMLALMGVVINDSLVLMTRFNKLQGDGMPVKEALFEAGKSRLRAIFLTTVTTVCGLLPLLSETSEQAQYLKPTAVSLAFGELFATPVTLILIPVLLGIGRYKQSCSAGKAGS